MDKTAIASTQSLSVHFPMRGFLGRHIGLVKALDGVSLSLYKGETYGLVGETGCGKSTLGRAIARLVGATSGTVLLEGKDIGSYADKEVRRKVQMIFQDPYTSLNPRQRIGDILIETLAIHHISNAAARMDIALEMLAKVGLHAEHFYRYPHELSGGQRQRVGVARAIISNPSLIICDEPVSALDMSVRSQIINLLLDLQDATHIAYLFISHDMSVIRYTSQRIGVMYLGHLVEEADSGELFHSPAHPYTQALLSAVPSSNPKIAKRRIVLSGELPSPLNPPAGCVFHSRCQHASEQCALQSPELREISGRHKAACFVI